MGPTFSSGEGGPTFSKGGGAQFSFFFRGSNAYLYKNP